jgi:hypothetical protein
VGGETGGSGLEQECGAKVLQRDGAQLFSNHWRRDQEEVAVTAEEEMEVRCRDFLMVTGEQAVGGMVNRAESGISLCWGQSGH